MGTNSKKLRTKKQQPFLQMQPPSQVSAEMQKKMRGRQQFKHQNQLVYEWEQDLNEINIYITPPDFLLPKNKDIILKNLKPGQKMPKFDIKIKNNHVSIAVDGNPPYINEALFKHIDTEESHWFIEDD